ncbi:MAG: hypothetical protein JWM61_2574 [Micrococcaceae bacterium]|jgi:hypothetical protein|nr:MULTISPECIES: hypothetical protein [Arthrobacter]MCU1633922.1 hypothetical protein [Micrococcaceae bacterium]MEC5198637.1 hypothetical protein [Arthrobacter sp. PL16]
MSTTRPPGTMLSDGSGLPRTTLLVMSGGRDAQGIGPLAEQLARETNDLLDTLGGTIARLALAHRSCTPDPEDQVMDDDAFAWVQQSLEDISATLRGLSLGRATEKSAQADAPRALIGLG